MSRKEAILLVSRALAVIQFVTAMLDVTYLPEWFVSFAHHSARASLMSTIDYDSYLTNLDRVHLVFLLLRIAGEAIFAIVLWNCGPWVESHLLPKSEGTASPE
jgi:hypothetical protein